MSQLKLWYIKENCEQIRDKCGIIEREIGAEAFADLRVEIEAIVIATFKIENEIFENSKMI